MAANALWYGDNLDVLRERIAPESVDLIYLDPPFNSNRSYNILFGNTHGEDARAQIVAFDDTWTWAPETEQLYIEMLSGGAPGRVADALQAMHGLVGEGELMAYLVMMAARLVELRRVIKSTGSIYLHCDPTASHYLKILMDAIFGPKNLRNEIVWCYTGPSAPRQRQFSRKHDIIFWYSVGETWTFNADAVRVAHAEKTKKNYKGSLGGSGFAVGDEDAVRELHEGGKIPEDYWNFAIAPRGKEYLGYPTQKPIKLLERIVAASSNEGDVVLDPFCGCGTTIAAAQALGRRWIGIDVTYIAIDLVRRRLEDAYGEKLDYELHGIPRDLAGAKALFKESPFDFERWAVSMVNGQPNEKQVGDKGIDGVIRFPLDAKASVGRCIVSVKGGGQVNPAMVRDLGGTITNHKAEMGVLITMDRATPGMIDAANHGGSYTWPVNGTTFPRVQLITAAQLLKGELPNLPPVLTPYLKATRHTVKPDQLALE